MEQLAKLAPCILDETIFVSKRAASIIGTRSEQQGLSGDFGRESGAKETID